MKTKPGIVKSKKVRCGSCYYFDNNLSKGGEIKPCKERTMTVTEGFQKLDSPICKYFLSDRVDFLSNKTVSLSELFSHIIEADFQNCQDAWEVGKSYSDYLKKENVDIPFDAQQLLETVSSLSRFRTLNYLCGVMGLAQYAPQIITAEIARYYKIPITTLPVPSFTTNTTIPDPKPKKKKKKKIIKKVKKSKN